MKAEQARQFVLDFFAELASGNPRCWDRVAEDATWQLMARAKNYPYPCDYTKASYRALCEGSADTFPSGLRFTIRGTTAEEDRVAVEAESYGMTREGKLYNNVYHLLVLLENGRIKTAREYLDSGHATEVLEAQARGRHDAEARLQGFLRTVRPDRTARLCAAGGGVRLRLGVDQRSLPALAPHPRPCAFLARLARRPGRHTRRIVMGTSVLTPTFRYHPSVVAQAFATLGLLFPGRVVLGLGTGESLNEVPASAIQWPEQKERTARFREAVRLIRELWSGERVSFEGQYYQTGWPRSMTARTRRCRCTSPAPGPSWPSSPVWRPTASSAPPARNGSCTPRPCCRIWPQGLRLPGAPPAASYDRLIEMKVSFDTDGARALADTKFWGALALTPQEKTDVEDPLQMERLADALPVERTASRWIVSTDPAEMVETDRQVRGPGLQPPGVPRARARPGALHPPVRRARAAAAARALRLTSRNRPAHERRSSPRRQHHPRGGRAPRHDHDLRDAGDDHPGDRRHHRQRGLPHMQGSLSASLDQITWVLTSYIVAAGIATPLAGWLPTASA